MHYDIMNEMNVTHPEKNFNASFLEPKNAIRPSAMIIMLRILKELLYYQLQMKGYDNLWKKQKTQQNHESI